MNFNVALKDTPEGGEVGRLERTSRIYPCTVCKTLTGWRFTYPDCPGVPCCSDECFDVLTENEAGLVVEATPAESIAV